MKYMFYRCFSALNAELPSMDRTSRSPFCSLTSTKHVTNKEHLAKTLDEKKSFASRTVEAFDMEGRISMDLMMAVEREHNFDTYKLDDIAKVFLGKSKPDVSPQDMFRTGPVLMS